MGLLKTDGSVVYRWRMTIENGGENGGITDDPVAAMIKVLNTVSPSGDAMVSHDYMRSVIDHLDIRCEMGVAYENGKHTVFNIRRIINARGNMRYPKRRIELEEVKISFYIDHVDDWCDVRFEAFDLDGVDPNAILLKTIKNKIATADTKAKIVEFIEELDPHAFRYDD